MESWKHIRLRAGLVLLITFVAYLPALRNGFIWDDVTNVKQNRQLLTGEGLKEIWVNPHASYQYYPLTYTAFWIEYHLWGLRPAGYHAVNIVLHALNAVLLGVLLEGLSVPGAWLAALIFAVHPVQVESVAWVTELKNVLSGFFFLASTLAYLRYRRGGERRGQWYGLALVLFLCALLSKTSTVSLPLALLAVVWWKDGRVRREDAWLLLPFFLATPIVLVTAWVEKHYVGAVGPPWRLSLIERCLVAGRVVWFDAGRLLWPHSLMFVYPRWQVDASVWWQYLFPLAAAAVVLIAWLLRRRLGKGPFVAVAFFAGMTAPVPAFFSLYYMRYSYVADHFQYLGSIGLIALAAAGATMALRNRVALIAVAAPVLIILGALSWRHCAIFHDEETLWRDTIARNPGCWMAYDNLALALEQKGDSQDAYQCYVQSLRIMPDDAGALNNMGIALGKEGRIEEAIGYFQQALRIQPDYAEAQYNLGLALLKMGRDQEAITHFEQAVRIKPDYPDAQGNLGNVLLGEGRIQEAIGHYEQALQIRPDDALMHYNLGLALEKAGGTQEAIRHFQEALRIRPDDPEAHAALERARAEAGDSGNQNRP